MPTTADAPVFADPYAGKEVERRYAVTTIASDRPTTVRVRMDFDTASVTDRISGAALAEASRRARRLIDRDAGLLLTDLDVTGIAFLGESLVPSRPPRRRR